MYVKYFQPWWRSWSFVYIYHRDYDLSILYVAMTTHVIFCIMPIHGHCTLMYLGLLYVLAVMCRVWLLYYTIGWLVLPPGSSSLHFWDGLIMYFIHHITPMTSHIRGASITADFTTHGGSHLYGLPCPSADSLYPMNHFCTFDVSKIIPKNMHSLQEIWGLKWAL